MERIYAKEVILAYPTYKYLFEIYIDVSQCQLVAVIIEIYIDASQCQLVAVITQGGWSLAFFLCKLHNPQKK